MVQKKVTQKAKAKTTPANSAKSLKSANNPKSVPLTNGYKNSKSQQAKKKAATETNSSESTETVVNSSEVFDNKTSESNSFDSKAIPQTEAGASKKNGIVEAVSKTNIEGDSNDKPSTSDNFESILSKESVPKKPKSVKRKISSDDAVKNSNIKPLTVNKTKAKKQKIQLEIPPLKSIPGKVFVVGENDVGQLGLKEDVSYKKRPFLLDLPYSIVDVAAGGMHSACLTENGEVLTFGCNDEGALGRVTENEEEMRIPRKVEIPERVVKICCGDSHSAALTESGQVYIWGNFRNSAGPMGLITNGVSSITPIRILTRITVVKIASGEDHIVCLSDDGIVYTCGCGELGQLGRLNSRICTDGGRKGLAALVEPAPVDYLKSKVPVDDVWTENSATFVKARKDGSIYAFGNNNYNQLGLKNKNTNENDKQVKFFPEQVSSFNDKKWQHIVGGQHHTLALDSDGVVHCLGRKEYGRLGLGENCEDALVPTVVPTLQNEKCNSVSCGNTVSFAVTEQGSLYSWGMSSSQLGQGQDDEDVHSPQLVKGELLTSWEVYKVAGGGQHALILACPKKGNKKTAGQS